MTQNDLALLGISCLDLTNLDDACSDQDIVQLCKRAKTEFGPVATICIWPKFIELAREHLRDEPIGITTVVNFPTGNMPLDDVLVLTEQARSFGADEFDLVIPYKELKVGNDQRAFDCVTEVRKVVRGKTLKVILETGELVETALITKASEIALEAGADFIKTSTGKVPVNATLGAAELMLNAIKRSGAPAGFKPAGGIKTLDDVRNYIELAERILGEGWVSPERFRIGASGVLDTLLATLTGEISPHQSSAY